MKAGYRPTVTIEAGPLRAESPLNTEFERTDVAANLKHFYPSGEP
jgi:hypothetical protein